MEIVFIRHGDPNYELDALTEKGILEAKALIPRIEKINADYYYVSPLGRARQTAQIAMERIDKEAKVLDWLREFPAVVKHICEPDPGPQCWDWMPSDWAKEPSFYDIDRFYDHPVMKKGHVKEIYEDVINHFDALLKKHGYAKNGKTFDVLKANHDTLCFFCHFGIECVLLSYLINVSPMILWHGFVASTSSVTIVNTEERQKGIASFRISHFGDTSHLDASGLEPSFSARFCECYSDDTRH
ncbi:MAG: histidine phosphatase family protein [Erysipelotrichaceae bacterium]|nr:histidine phosphatase family protein [Erysipelotrichaceae bacterium]MBQ2232462.1 histidine phosphatase family protein [Erysipelotrichaceae bacterium]MBQ3994975.1 histidine phosphatase family protein [Erysipelotrichaceae bacterium]